MEMPLGLHSKSLAFLGLIFEGLWWLFGVYGLILAESNAVHAHFILYNTYTI